MMTKLLESNRLYSILGWTLLGLLLTLLALEGWRYGIKPSESNNQQLIEQSLERAAQHFLDRQQTLVDNSENLAATLRPSLLQNEPPRYQHNILEQFPRFWSSTLMRKNTPVVWQGFALTDRQSQQQQQAESTEGITLKKYNNVIYWEHHTPFSIQDSTGSVSYDLFTSYRISQSNPLAIGSESEFNIFDSEELSTAYPLNFSVFSQPSSLGIESKALTDLDGDSVGVVYATADQFQQTKTQWQQGTNFWRSVYALICFIILVVILFAAADRLALWHGLLLQLLFIGIGWGILAYTSMTSYWVLTLSGASANAGTITSLSVSITNAIFALLTSLTIARKILLYRHRFKPDWYLSSISFAGIYGILNTLAIVTFFDILYHMVNNSGVPLLDLRIFPELGTVVLYLAVGLSTLALGHLLIALNRLLFRITQEHLKLAASVLVTSFFISLFVIQLFMPEGLIFNWIFFASITGFAIVFGVAIGYARKVLAIVHISPLRMVVFGSLAIAIAGTPAIYQASLNNTDEELWETALNYSKETDPFAAGLTEKLLTRLEQNFRDISPQDLQENQSALQTRFTQTIQNLLSPEWNTYSFDLQLINTSGDLIADYATDLNSPNWLNIYNITTLQAVTEIEQINKSTIRPVVQLPQLVNQQDYRTFYRGWIPVFGTSEDAPIAWILCSIYQERPEFNKPIRAVLASLTYEDWNTAYLMQKFSNGELINSRQKGFAGYFPKYRSLGSQKMQALQNDSLIYLTEQSPEYTYRTLLWREADESTIKVSTTLPDYRLILFSFFRLSFTLLLIGGLLIFFWQLLTWGRFSVFGKQERFQDRLLDSFLLATLVFLAFLIGTSHYAIEQQNQDIVRQELVDKLERLSNTIESNEAVQNNRDLNNSFSLDSLTTPLDVDASFYAGLRVSETTTPQIYQQHLLPAVLPYNIYQQLFNQRQQDAYSTVNLADQQLLIGYQSILDGQNNPVATIAIPTFLQSPKYDQQLLETTSYLILIYLFVFGLFILGTTLISKQLTRPLVYIQRGLNKISGGNLDTTIPVKSNDEIGNLAEAYNNMVSRLKQLQKELAAAEREAAWKEMAQQVAHEIKNPLTPMKLNVQHLERQLKSEHQDPEELKKRVQKITNNLIEQIQSLNNIASDFSKFSQPVEKDFTSVDLTNLLSSVVELYEHDEKVNIKFQQNSAVYIQGIADELKRVVINLVKNAYEAMPNGGEIVLRLYKKRQHVFIEVEDNGEGIPEEDRPNIFVPNFSTKSSGTGLGLAICKKIIEAHEGSISFASVEEEGTTFVIKLPQE